MTTAVDMNSLQVPVLFGRIFQIDEKRKNQPKGGLNNRSDNFASCRKIFHQIFYYGTSSEVKQNSEKYTNSFRDRLTG